MTKLQAFFAFAGLLGALGGFAGVTSLFLLRRQGRLLEGQTAKLAAETERTRVDTATQLIQMLEGQLKRLIEERDELLAKDERSTKRIEELEAKVQELRQSIRLLKGIER